LRLKFNIIGENGYIKDFDLKIEDLFDTGKSMKLNANNCYMKVFRSVSGDQNTWYVGNAFMEKYYVAFDMSPKIKNNYDYVQVIIAEKSTTWTPNDYVPEEEEEEVSPGDQTDDKDKE